MIAYVKHTAPATVKEAAATVPVADDNVTPPEPPVVRVPAAANTTVPLVDYRTAMLPKFMSVTLVIVIGVMIVADAVADTCAKEDVADAITITAAATSTLEMFFILFVFLSLSYLLVSLFVSLFDRYIANYMPKL